MAQTDDDPVVAAGLRREQLWLQLNKLHHNPPGPPECTYAHTVSTDGECAHMAHWRARIAAAWAEYQDALRECDRVARECFIGTSEAAG